jgi:hypothetical protein
MFGRNCARHQHSLGSRLVSEMFTCVKFAILYLFTVMFKQAGPDFVIKGPLPIWQYFHFCHLLPEQRLWNVFAVFFLV